MNSNLKPILILSKKHLVIN